MVVHWPGNVASASNLVLGREYAGGAEEEGGGRWCAEREMEGAVGADSDACGYRGARVVMGCAGIELLRSVSHLQLLSPS